ncbi:MAG TPA: orotate phosphoribosyltransferase [Candidatus Saccharimonadia bacterium]|nr:orotate phosphoribosyltransferase [Candidatus Saccharimonadia bacterium]
MDKVANNALILELNKIGAIKFGEFTLKSGIVSPIYIDLRILVTYPKLLKKIAKSYGPLLKQIKYDRLAGIPYAALPIACAISLEFDQPWVYNRKEVKDYGTKKIIEGEFKPGETIVVIDDLITKGDSKLEVVEPFTKEGLVISDFVVFIDREQGGKQTLATHGFNLHAVLTITDILNCLLLNKLIDKTMYGGVKEFLRNN